MDEDNLNIEIRKFLKKVGISSQRIIETTLTSKFQNGEIQIDDEIELEMKLSINNFQENHLVKEIIKIK
ncbi:MAG: hypothetical protein CMG00_00450 [Candidatus Marinimicrobia bacterium]|nr:hypothetical protein [Candidatus Neomarinimicrobiota bacterium]|tara:strand:- start:1145 stop:1351 length:207 start_codon:yes stop_codon:yes gene_type:complete